MLTKAFRHSHLANISKRSFSQLALGAMATTSFFFYGIDFATSKQSVGGESGEASSAPIVIAHRGASGYIVEHSEGAKVLAHAMGADYIEQDVVMTKDKQFIVTHDITMEETTNVEQVYPDRHRKDGKWYFADFTWEEIQSLSLHERTRKDGTTQAFPDRFPGGFGQRILRLEDEIKLLRGLDKTTNRKTGLYIELKGPSFHRKEFDVPMEEALVKLLDKLEVTPESNCYLQCFELDALKNLKETYRCELPLIYLIGKPLDAQSVTALQGKVDGVGPSLELLAERTPDGSVRSTGLVEQAHAAGLKVHPYTIRTEQQPRWSDSIEQTHKVLIEDLKVDGFFTDFPDLGRSAVLKAR